MRVITGALRGKRLDTLDGLETRPTQDKIKEAIFSIIQFDIPGADVLDLFAGSGQLGIEAISRGAKSCVFVDKSRDAARIIRRNVENCGIADCVQIRNQDAVGFLSLPCKGFDIALIDPPYGQGLVLKSLELLESKMNDCGIVVCEHEAGLELPDTAGRLKVKKRYGYGKKVALTVYTSTSEDNDNE